MKNKPIIGVMPLVDNEKESLWMLPGYFDGVRQAGGLPIMLPLTANENEIKQLFELCDGFLFTGGHDVCPELYGEAPISPDVVCSRERDDMERRMLSLAIEADKPVLGICRGIQFINAALGGTLWQDLPSQRKSPINHHQSPPYDVPVHSVNIMPNSPLSRLFDVEALAVNSYHHQAIRTLAPALTPMAESPDGLIEAVYMPDRRFVWAVQWHPEFNYKVSGESRKLFSSFVLAAKIAK